MFVVLVLSRAPCVRGGWSLPRTLHSVALVLGRQGSSVVCNYSSDAGNLVVRSALVGPFVSHAAQCDWAPVFRAALRDVVR